MKRCQVLSVDRPWHLYRYDVHVFQIFAFVESWLTISETTSYEITFASASGSNRFVRNLRTSKMFLTVGGRRCNERKRFQLPSYLDPMTTLLREKRRVSMLSRIAEGLGDS
jgi:hypothetical protein